MKFRRMLATGAIAGLLAVAPASAALATEDDGYAAMPNVVSVTGSFTPGGSVTVIVDLSRIPQKILDAVRSSGVFLQLTTSAIGGGSAADAQIAGTVTSAVKSADGDTATFAVTLPEEPVEVTGTANSGSRVLGSYSFTVNAATDGATDASTDGDADGSTSASGSDNNLSATGFENPGLAAGAAGLLVVGAGAVFIAARRRA